ncbi:TetR family transcriptional regulator [Corynebacterium suedekumii]|nr:TetR family transcriptional regulator [Corynebacterium suedekumii]
MLVDVQLSRDTIVTAAMEILDSYGLADMTMRRVATHLGVAPGALYWHLANKQQLIAAIADRILAPALDTTDPASPEELADRLRTALLAHRDGAELVSAALSQPDSGDAGGRREAALRRPCPRRRGRLPGRCRRPAAPGARRDDAGAVPPPVRGGHRHSRPADGHPGRGFPARGELPAPRSRTRVTANTTQSGHRRGAQTVNRPCTHYDRTP